MPWVASRDVERPAAPPSLAPARMARGQVNRKLGPAS